MSLDLYILLIGLFALFLLKLVINVYKLIRAQKILNLYIEWMVVENTSFNIYHYKSELLDLVSVIPNKMLPFVQAVGYGQIAKGQTNVMDQFPSLRTDFALAITQTIEEAIGYYKYQIRQCFNPIYWILLIIWLPKNFTLFIGLNDELKTVKVVNFLLQLLYWLIIFLKVLGLNIIPFLQHILSNYIAT